MKERIAETLKVIVVSLLLLTSFVLMLTGIATFEKSPDMESDGRLYTCLAGVLSLFTLILIGIFEKRSAQKEREG